MYIHVCTIPYPSVISGACYVLTCSVVAPDEHSSNTDGDMPPSHEILGQLSPGANDVTVMILVIEGLWVLQYDGIDVIHGTVISKAVDDSHETESHHHDQLKVPPIGVFHIGQRAEWSQNRGYVPYI